MAVTTLKNSLQSHRKATTKKFEISLFVSDYKKTMHHALVSSIYFSVFLALTTLSGTTGDPGPQVPSNLPDDSSLLQTQAQVKKKFLKTFLAYLTH